MLKLLIADDEEEIRKGIRCNVDWEANGISVCGEAEDGDETLTLIEELNPDVVVIDIKMPGISGLEVLEALVSSCSTVRSVILSGYDDFTYAQKAIRLGASDYLLKPCRSRDILGAVLKIKAELDAEKSKNDVLAQLEAQFNANIPLLKEKLLINLLTNKTLVDKETLNNFQLFNIQLMPASLTVFALKINDFSVYIQNHSYCEVEFALFSIKNLALEILQVEFCCESLTNDNNIVFIANVDKHKTSDLFQQLEAVRSSIKENLGFLVSIGIGRSYSDLESASNSYIEALKSIELSFLFAPGIIIDYDEIQKIENPNTMYPLNEEKNIINSILAGDKSESESRLDAYVFALLKNNSSKEFIQKSCYALILSLYHLCLEKNLVPDGIFGCNISSLDEILHLDTLDQTRERIKAIIIELSEAIASAKTGNKLISLTIQFIEENYEKDLTLETVSQKVYVHPKYLSTLFKQVVGENFVDYIQKVRVEKACELLKDIRLRTYEVANKVGYTDNKYFCQIFKKIKGLPPSQYREL